MLLILPGTLLFAAGPPAASIADVQDHALSQVEKEIVSLAEAMPADKYDFAPTQGTFQGVRTFGQQMSHVAVVLDEVAAGMLGEKEPDTGQSENGPASLKGKDAIVAYLKSAFERAHRAVKTLTVQNLTEPVKLSWGSIPRASLAELMAVHTMDHYGQAVVYARMNNVVPPASRS
jgi:uncharacterized damage-inducible protein DinB